MAGSGTAWLSSLLHARRGFCSFLRSPSLRAARPLLAPEPCGAGKRAGFSCQSRTRLLIEAYSRSVTRVQRFCQETPIPFRDEEYPPLPDYELSVPGAEANEVFCVRARGLPWSCTAEDVLTFFSDCRICNGADGIHFTLNSRGRRSGDALVELESEEDIQKALEMHRKFMGHRYIEVFELQSSDVEMMLKNLQSIESQTANEGVVRLLGLPYSSTEADIHHFFTGLEIAPGGITFTLDRRGRRSGEAFVQFVSPETAAQALLKHKDTIGDRYIEIYPSRRNEIHLENTQEDRKEIESCPTASYLLDSDEEEDDSNATHYNNSEMKSRLSEQTSWKTWDSSMYASTSAVHNIHMRGLPFQFFYPVKPMRIYMEYGPDGRATGEADVMFKSHADAVASMAKDRAHIQHRYIELYLNSPSKAN
ncbi:G-rich sequence factor 1 isoform X2 [Latimeria chalumnae]|uniref:G-rich RNA sequence binding factor 1 n=1 Tax=Latimeria chalumnae TaxID=7897 RepID=H3AMC6_LATCH